MTVKTQELALRAKAEHQKVLDLINALHAKIAVVPWANLHGWLRELRDCFEKFRAHHLKHMALEEHDGYMVAVLELRPTLSGEVDRLKHEHEELQRICDRVYRVLRDLTTEDRLLVRDCRNRIASLLGYVEHHENDENLLITYVFTHDIGTKD